MDTGRIDSDDEDGGRGDGRSHATSSKAGLSADDDYTQTQSADNHHSTSTLVADSCADMECITVKRVLEAAVHLITTGIVVPNVPEKLVGLFTKIYKLQVCFGCCGLVKQFHAIFSKFFISGMFESISQCS